MEFLTEIVKSLTIVGLIVSAIVTYLKINKIWTRKHIKDVASSVSVAAALLSLFTTLPFLLQFVIVEPDPVAASKFAISLIAMVIFLMIGSGFWVADMTHLGWFRNLRAALRSESGELANLVQVFAKPREAATILKLLRMVSMIDQQLDEKEREIIAAVAKPWGILPEQILAGAENDVSDIGQVRQGFAEYLDCKPPAKQVVKVFDLVSYLIEADKRISREEKLIFDEVGHMIKAYLDEDYKPDEMFEVLVVPQNEDQRRSIPEVVTRTEIYERSGGEAFVGGVYFSEMFAEEMAKKYRDRGFFSTTEASSEDTIIAIPGL